MLENRCGCRVLKLYRYPLTVFAYFILLTKVVARFIPNILHGAHLQKNEISKLLKLYLFKLSLFVGNELF